MATEFVGDLAMRANEEAHSSGLWSEVKYQIWRRGYELWYWMRKAIESR